MLDRREEESVPLREEKGKRMLPTPITEWWKRLSFGVVRDRE